MYGVCFRREPDPKLQDQWSFVFSNFGVGEIWERDKQDGDGKIYQPTIAISTCADLPRSRPLVVLAPKEGRYIQGVKSLVEFYHPPDAIYVFGGSHLNLSDQDDFGGRKPDHLVYIPTVEHEMYAHAAGYITLYDRMVKHGKPSDR